MESIFVLEEGERGSFLRQIMQSFGCVYVCVWSYLPPPSNFLVAVDGVYGDTKNEGSLSLGRRLFDVYRESIFYVDNGRIPGLAFKNNITYMELKMHDCKRMVSAEVQLHFYQEAGIKTVVFLGCSMGEIELGMSADPQEGLIEREMNKLISIQAQAMSSLGHKDPSSSSSSLQSLSVDSPELLFTNIRAASLVQEPLKLIQGFPPPIRNPHFSFPTSESEDAAMTSAILAVLSSPQQHATTTTTTTTSVQLKGSTAFTRYRGEGRGSPIQGGRQSKFKRAVSFFRNLNWRTRQELHMQSNRPTVTQLHHMISERKRREKLNESFHVLRSLLPPGSKKDKASVLSNTTEYLISLKSQVAELIKKNQMLETQISGGTTSLALGDHQRVNVETTQVSSSTSQERFLDLRVSVRGDIQSSLMDLIVGLMEFLKQQRNVSLLSLESNTTMLGSVPLHGIMLRLKIEGDEFDNSSFEEGVRRVVDDLAH